MSYFCLFSLKGLIKVLFLVFNDTSKIKYWLPAHFIKTVSSEQF